MSEQVQQDAPSYKQYRERSIFFARQIVDVASDPEVERAWRNGHNGIDFEQHESAGQVPIFAVRHAHAEVENGDWICRWKLEDEFCWILTNTNFPEHYELTSPPPEQPEPSAPPQECLEVCDTTMTPRRPRTDCGCDTYPENLGPCKEFHPGQHFCVYCDHTQNCHIAADYGIDLKTLPPCPTAPTSPLEQSAPELPPRPKSEWKYPYKEEIETNAYIDDLEARNTQLEGPERNADGSLVNWREAYQGEKWHLKNALYNCKNLEVAYSSLFQRVEALQEELTEVNEAAESRVKELEILLASGVKLVSEMEEARKGISGNRNGVWPDMMEAAAFLGSAATLRGQAQSREEAK